jgi:hypothetical protein
VDENKPITLQRFQADTEGDDIKMLTTAISDVREKRL